MFKKLKKIFISVSILSLFLGGVLAFCQNSLDRTHVTANPGAESEAHFENNAVNCCALGHYNENDFKTAISQTIINQNANNNFILAVFIMALFGGLALLFPQSRGKFLGKALYYQRQFKIWKENYIFKSFLQGLLNPKIYSV
ncbi:MAG: hypothetical protein HYZ51_03160 [Candidatus Doudnabacteria bacterium]|nr:hypothetical protein [Candidatus Doudnabacteria bacterium]